MNLHDIGGFSRIIFHSECRSQVCVCACVCVMLFDRFNFFMELCGMEYHDMVWHGAVWYGMTRYDMLTMLCHFIGLVAVLTLSLDVIGYDKNIASWCWIDPNTPAILFWQFFTGKAWEMSAYLLTIIMYTVVRCFLLKHASIKVEEWSRSDCRGGSVSTSSAGCRFKTKSWQTECILEYVAIVP